MDAIAEGTAGRLAYRVGQLEYDKAMLQSENESLRSLLAGLENRVEELETSHGNNLPEGAVASSQQHPDRAEHRNSEALDLAHDDRLPPRNGADVP